MNPESADTGSGALLEVEQAEVGSYPRIASLNPAMDADHPLLKVRLRVHWTPPLPGEAFSTLRRRLEQISPSLRRHRCAGDDAYQVADGRHEEEAQEEAPGDRAKPGPAPATRGDGAAGQATFEAPLALAHLIEHLIIDVVGYIAGPRKVAGVTGAPRGTSGTYDIFVECHDPMLAAVAVPLALAWARTGLDGTPLDGAGLPALELARHLYRARPATLNAAQLHMSLGLPPEEVDRALAWLEEHGYACRIPYAMNLSALPYIRVCGPPPKGNGPG